MFQSHFGGGGLEIMHPTTTQKDTTYTKIFVGGLPYHTTDASLRKHFATFGDIDEAAVITDRQTGKSRGYGFVTMMDRRGADRACKDPSPIIDGRKANVNLAYLGAKPRSPPTGLSGYSVGMQQIHPALLQRQYGLAQQYLHPQTFLHPGLLLQSQLGPASSSSSLGSSPYLDYASAYAHYAAGLENYYHQHHLLASATPSSAGYLGYSLSPSAPPTPPAVATPLATVSGGAASAPQAALLRYPLLHQPDRLH